MTIADSIRRQITPIHPEGYIFIAAFAVATIILFWIWNPLGWIGLILTAWCASFFRDPIRVTPMDGSLVISPADGVVSSVGAYVPPPELGLGDTAMTRVSVFMSVFDCHVNRTPVDGRVVRVAYKPGLFINADLDKASEENERQHILVENANGTRIGFTQIAGLVARRIVPFVKAGDIVGLGQRIGLIRFGSRVDVYLPAGTGHRVALGQRTIAGETVIAKLGEAERTIGAAQ